MENKGKKEITAILIGNSLKKHRKLFRMTQDEFSEFLEIGTQYYGQIERGEKSLGVDKLLDVCRRLNIKLDELVPIEVSEDKYYTFQKNTLQTPFFMV